MNLPLREATPEAEETAAQQVPQPPEKPAADIQAVLTLLGRTAIPFAQKEEKRTLDLRSTNLAGADLNEANLQGAKFNGADLQGTHLTGAKLPGAHLSKANLRGAYLYKANLQGANLKGAELGEAHLEAVDLRRAKKLTKEQLAEAIMDGKTELPDYLKEPNLEKSNSP